MTRLAIAAAVVAIIAGGVLYFSTKDIVDEQSVDMAVSCQDQGLICPDGSDLIAVDGECSIVNCPREEVPEDIIVEIESLSDDIIITSPLPGHYIKSPLIIEGKARGIWFFEGDFPVTLTNWNGKIIAEYFVTAQEEWMTEDFVTFSGELEFSSPIIEEDPEEMRRGWLILQRDNPKDGAAVEALEIPVWFSQ